MAAPGTAADPKDGATLAATLPSEIARLFDDWTAARAASNLRAEDTSCEHEYEE
ncbi:hypothetical protein [Cypionkella sp.]|uniref:hypothetical protein n=1 Tax=Cypionkella sp. TaxID=2811411 RepID=UPI0026164FCA|nr:hypothetical protein [Cypionkella sp.]